MLLGALVSAVQNLVLVALPHGGQRQARRNAWLTTVEDSPPPGDRYDHPGGRASRRHAGAK